MKTGQTHIDFLTELKENKFAKRDFVADTRNVKIAVKEKSPVNLGLELAEIKTTAEAEAVAPPAPAIMDVSRHAIGQICARLKIPFKYAERLWKDHPDLLADQVNALFSREPSNRLIRTLGGNVRAFLSDRYRILDNFDVATQVIPVVEKVLGVSWRDAIRSCAVTENRMYIKVVHPTMTAKIPMPEGVKMGVGHNFFVDKVQAGIKIENSEIGLGRVLISPAIFTERCTNYATFESSKYAHVHLGRKIGEGAQIAEVFSDETKALDDAAILGKIKDVTQAALDGTFFDKQVKLLTDARADVIPEGISPIRVIEVVKDQNGLTETEADTILNNLIAGADLSRYGIHAAITQSADAVESYDRSTELEALGGKIIELPTSDWQVITKKAA